MTSSSTTLNTRESTGRQKISDNAARLTVLISETVYSCAAARRALSGIPPPQILAGDHGAAPCQ